ncbi:uncharacterized protein BO80DRAFT_364335 [Aspergillus ibericus CBS 121593]|uniref:BTB domain-containing protein n=1 Tax=Aspergillus ibericus CBS 121593 TaxID=1448316 RepID=A0A395GP73_9EURO|nr:hypothetical protein BO80DRAFT_364335 [Aspergillus ibericus CBS 121593]RAK97295.1 hypothetical protein BO80DRAFT_364335 [Aspergillus ibericus CBS 121593]
MQTTEDNVIILFSHSTTMKVERAKLNSASEYFQAMFRRARWTESKSQTITLEDDNIKAMELLFRKIHGTMSSMTDKRVTVAEWWHLVMACDKYDIDPKSLGELFQGWHKASKVKEEYQKPLLKFEAEVAFPCYAFDTAEAFKEVTKKLVYASTGHIVESNPTNIGQMHLPPRVMQQLNAARGRLRNILHKGLFERIGEIVKHGNCSCKETTVFDYLRELSRIKVWPLEDSLRDMSIDEIIEHLWRFDSARMRQYRGTSSDNRSGEQWCSCRFSWHLVVQSAASRVSEYFDGLCLDCMDSSKNLRDGGNKDDDYWHYHEKFKRFDAKCRVDHGQPTWYFSFMGRREKKGLIAD